MTGTTAGPTAGTALEELAAAIGDRDWVRLRAVLADGLTVRLVHTGETFDADGFVGFNRDYPGAWTYHRDEVVDAGTRAVLRSHTVVDDDTWHAASFAEIDASGRIVALTEVWTEAVQPPPERTTP